MPLSFLQTILVLTDLSISFVKKKLTASAINVLTDCQYICKLQRCVLFIESITTAA